MKKSNFISLGLGCITGTLIYNLTNNNWNISRSITTTIIGFAIMSIGIITINKLRSNK